MNKFLLSFLIKLFVIHFVIDKQLLVIAGDIIKSGLTSLNKKTISYQSDILLVSLQVQESVLPPDAYLSLVFPAQYNIGQLRDANPSLYCSQIDLNFDFVQECYTQYNVNANEIVVTNLDTSQQQLRMFIFYLINPNSTKVDPLIVSINDVDDNKLDMINLNITLIPDQLISAKLQLVDQYTSNVSNLTLEFQPKHSLFHGSTIKLEIPSINRFAPLQNQKIFLKDTSQCYGIQGIDAVLKCKLIDNILTIENGYNIYENIQQTNVKITITQFQNPYSLESENGFNLTTIAPDNGLIDQMLNISVKAYFPNEPSSIQIFNTNTEINTLTNYTIMFSPKTFYYSGIQMNVQFPAQFKFSQPENEMIVVSTSSKVLNFTYSNQIFTIFNVTDKYVEGQQIGIMFNKLRNYNWVGQSETLQIQILNQHQFIIEEVKSNIIYITTPGNIQIVSIEPECKVVQATTKYRFSFKITNNLTQSSELSIKFPPQISLTNRLESQCNLSEIVNIASNISCIVSNNYLTIKDLIPGNQTHIPGQLLIQFDIDQVKNYDNVKTTDGFEIESYENKKLIDKSSQYKLTFNAGKINVSEFKTITSFMTYKPSQYQITFQLEHQLPVGGQIIIQLPADLNLQNQNQQASCNLKSGFGFQSTCNFNLNQNTISISNLDTNNSAQNFVLLLSNIYNARSMKPYEPIIINTTNSQNIIIDRSDDNQVPFITLSETHTLKLFDVTALKLDVGIETEYRFFIQSEYSLLNGDVLLIQLPNILQAGNQIECQGIQGFLGPIQCTCTNGMFIRIYISSNIQASQILEVSVKYIKNPYSQQQAAPFICQILTKEGFLSQSITHYQGLNNYQQVPFTQVQIVAQKLITGINSSYTFTIEAPQALHDNCSILIIFPNQLSIESEAFSVDSIAGIESIFLASYLNIQQIFIQGIVLQKGIDTGVKIIKFAINGIKNPASLLHVKGVSIDIQMFDQYSNKYMFKNQSIDFQYICTACYGSITTKSLYTSTITNISLNFVPKDVIPLNSKVVLTFPKVNQFAPLERQRPYIQPGVHCFGIQGIEGTVSCDFNQDVLIINNGYTAYSNTDKTPVQIIITSFLTPHSLEIQGSIKLYLLDQSQNQVIQNENIEVQVLYLSRPKTVSISSSDYTIQKRTNLTISIVPLSFLNANSSVQITFPAQFNLTNIIDEISLIGNQNGNQKLLTFQYANNSFTLPRCIESYLENEAFNIQFVNIRNPNECQNTDSFAIKLISENGFLVEQQDTDISYTTMPGSITDIRIETFNYLVGEETFYLISFRISNSLTAQGQIHVAFPKQLQVAQRSQQYFEKYMNINNNSLCDVFNNIFIISAAFPPDGVAADSIISFVVSQVINPPTSIQLADNFIISTYDANRIVDQSQYKFDHQFKSGKIVLESFSNIGLGQMTEELTNYRLRFTTRHFIPMEGKLYIRFPSDIDLQKSINLLNIQPSCQFSEGFGIYAECNFNDNEIKISNIRQTGINANTTFDLTIKAVVNARSTKPYNNLDIQSTDAFDNVIDQISSSPKFAIALPNTQVSCEVSTSSHLISDNATYTFNISKIFNSIESEDYLKIQLPEGLSIQQSAISCTWVTIDQHPQPANCKLDLNEMNSNNSLIIYIEQHKNNNSSLLFTVRSIINPSSEKPIQPIIFELFSKDNYIVMRGKTELSKQFFTALQLQDLDIIPESLKVGSITKYLIQFRPAKSIESGSYVLIKIPPYLSIDQTQLSLSVLEGLDRDQNNNNITIKKNNITSIIISNLFQDSSQITLSISGIKNPEEKVKLNDYINLEVYGPDGGRTQYANYEVMFSYQCKSECTNCVYNADHCLTCQMNYFLLDYKCLKQCPSGYVPYQSSCLKCQTKDPEGICQLCDTQNLAKCIQCVETFTVSATSGLCEKSGPMQVFTREERNDDLVSFFFDKSIKDFVYISIYCTICIVFSVMKKLCRKDMRALTFLLIYWSLLEPICSVILFIHYFLEANLQYIVLSMLAIAINTVLQILAARYIWQILCLDNQFLLIKGTYKRVSIYNTIALFWNYKYFLIYISRNSPIKQLHDMSFSLPNEYYTRHQKSLKINILCNLYQLAIQIAYWLQTFNSFSQIAKPVFLFEYPFYTLALLFLMLYHLYFLEQQIKFSVTPYTVIDSKVNLPFNGDNTSNLNITPKSGNLQNQLPEKNYDQHSVSIEQQQQNKQNQTISSKREFKSPSQQIIDISDNNLMNVRNLNQLEMIISPQFKGDNNIAKECLPLDVTELKKNDEPDSVQSSNIRRKITKRLQSKRLTDNMINNAADNSN